MEMHHCRDCYAFYQFGHGKWFCSVWEEWYDDYVADTDYHCEEFHENIHDHSAKKQDA